MRTFLGFVAALVVAGFPFAAAASVYPGSAPADEYFGPHKQSILEIRNRLDRLEEKSPRELIESNAVLELDDLAASISDWHAQYPNDPWLPRAYARLLRVYHRAGQSTSDQAVAMLDEMQDAYPNAPETSMIAMLYGVGSDAPQVAAAPMYAAPASPVMVPVAPVAIAAAPAPAFAADAWMRFGSMRGGMAAVAPAGYAVPAAYPVAAPSRSTSVTVNVTVNKTGP
jgi:hypothetical protein